MPPHELQELANNNANWKFLGKGSFHNVYISKKPITLDSYTGLVVFKKARIKGDKLSSIDRSIIKWHILNPKHPVARLENGWIAPYLGNQQASDFDL